MKKVVYLIIVSIIIACFSTACSKNQNPGSENREPIAVDAATADSFSSLEEFLSQVSQSKGGESVADLNTLNHFYVPQAMPEGYKMYKINAKALDVAFFYLPEEYTLSWDLNLQGEISQKHFMFISSRGAYSFDSIMDQHSVSTGELIDGKYAVIDHQGAQDIIIWEQDGEVLMLYVPAELNYTDVLPYCTVEKYTRNTATQSFDVEDVTQ